ncbi:MAG: nucleotidyltransferase family protein [Thermoplasmata archaeon]
MIRNSDISAAKSIVENSEFDITSEEVEESLEHWIRNKIIYTLYKKTPNIFDSIQEKLREDTLRKCKELDIRQAKVEQTVTSVYRLISNINPILIKTLKEFPYAASDVDFLFCTKRDIEYAVEILERAGYTVKKTREPNKLSAYKFENLSKQTENMTENPIDDKKVINVDLYSSIGWSGIEYLNNEDIFRTKRICKIGDLEIGVPSLEFEFLITSAHLGTQVDREVLFMDVLHLILLSSKGLDFSLIVDKANDSGMSAIAYYILYLIDKFSKEVFSKPVCEKEVFDKLRFSRYLKRVIEKELEELTFPMKISVLTHRGLRKVKAWHELQKEGLLKMLENEYEYSLQTFSHILKRRESKKTEI